MKTKNGFLRRACAIILSMLMLIVGVPMTAGAQTEETEGYFKYSVEDGQAMVTGLDSAASGDITVPSTLGGYPVVTIAASA